MNFRKLAGLAMAGMMIATPLAASAATPAPKPAAPCKGLKGAKYKECRANLKTAKKTHG